MIRGHVNDDREAIIPLELVAPDGTILPLRAVVDTGFNGYLTLSEKFIDQFCFQFAGQRRATLGDGSVVVLEMVFAKVQWFGAPCEILAMQAEGGPLAGMSLFDSCRLTVESRAAGLVTIERLETTSLHIYQ